MRFAQEIWLWIVPLLPVLWVLLRATDRKAASRMHLLLGENARSHVEGANIRLRSWRRFLFFAGLFWLLLALARPQWGASEVTVTQRGSDIVVALDISNSMLAEDVPPNRMERAKTELESFLGRLEDSRVGLVFFAGSAFVQCPLTLDYGTAGIFLKMAGPDMMSEQGTAIAAALATGRQLLAKGREGAPGGTFQAILLVTDGEDLEGDWEAEAEACRKDGIRLIPVGVGDEAGGLIPAQDDRGRAAGFMKDDEGKVVMTRLDMVSLEKMASIGGGSPFRIGVDGLAGDRLFAELKRLGRRDLEERRISAYQERYLLPLILALACFALQMLLRPRAAVPGRAVFAGTLLLAGMLAATQAAAGPILPGGGDMAKGRQKYLAGEFEDALRKFESALVQDPEDPLASLAVGETLFQLERYEEALAEFERARSLTTDDELKAEALYNAGTSLLAAGDFQKASEKLRSSLFLDPSQNDAVHNLEVALELLEEQEKQEQQQEQQSDQENEDQENEDQEEQQQEQQKKEEQEQQEQEQQEQEQDQQDQEQQEQEQEQQQPQQEPSEDQEEQAEPEESDGEELTQEQALQILKALDRDEEELKRSVQKRLRGGKPKSGKKW